MHQQFLIPSWLLRLIFGYFNNEVRKLLKKGKLIVKSLGNIVSPQRLFGESCSGHVGQVPCSFKILGSFYPLTLRTKVLFVVDILMIL